MTGATHSPRERMVYSAAQLIRRNGVAATGLRDIVAHAEAPRGSLQHYFPGGKEQLVNEAIAWGARYASRRVDRYIAALPKPTPSKLFAAMAQQWIDEFSVNGYGVGCPIAAASIDCADTVESTRAVTAMAFEEWIRPVARALTGMGVPSRRSRSLATVLISTLEGAILIARAEQDVRALRSAVRELGPMLDAAVESAAVR
jgi:AcrR family transcriptional regulator